MLAAGRELAEAGINTGATNRNRMDFDDGISLPADLPRWRNNMLYDPQTAGPLLVVCNPSGADDILALFHHKGYAAAAIIGECQTGDPLITVR